jgi:hypothetical protein
LPVATADGAGWQRTPVRFDHGAAAAATTRLVELAGLLDEVVERRRIRLSGLTAWEGARRAEFDIAIAHNQRAAADVAERCRATAARIRRAAAAAGQAPTAW